MSVRREQRISLVIPVRVSGLDANGQLFEQEAGTIDVTTTGARLSGIRHPLHRGFILTVQRGSSKAKFRVMWVAEEGSVDQGQIGLQLVESGKFIWGIVLPRLFGDHFRSGAQASFLPEIPLKAALKADPGAFD
jgi:hypothetical protein